jgi:hypothetical protein
MRFPMHGFVIQMTRAVKYPSNVSLWNTTFEQKSEENFERIKSSVMITEMTASVV